MTPPSWAVVDASVAIKWMLPEVDSDRALSLTGSRLIAPDLLNAECANALWRNARIGRIEHVEARALMDRLSRAPIEWVACTGLMAAALDLSFELDHPVYDCLYAALAVRRSIPLVSADDKLGRKLAARPELGIELIPLNIL